ncbi:MAG: NAD(+) diphosphatase [Lachnospiraceae bacterium]|nr:NAD(+) diphosphatase [Lachnospiraceae bacterium]
MIQDIGPSRLHNQYKNIKPSEEDLVLAFDKEGKILTKVSEEGLEFTRADLAGYDAIYFFSVDEDRYFMSLSATPVLEGYEYRSVRQLRDEGCGKELFAAFTAYHLWRWYSDNRYCGVCGKELVPDDKERAQKCKGCGKIIYPRINPAVIVGVINKDRILITKYRTGYAHSALIAGFTEIGETLEETVEREVMEEAGIRVKNIRYYKSQPWGMAQDILAGFFCDVDGDDTIRMDEGELKYASWVERSDIELQPNDLSLTNEMMKLFKETGLSCRKE